MWLEQTTETHLDPLIVDALPRLLAERADALLHLARRAPSARHDLADAAHGLRVGRDDRDGARVLQDVLGRDRLGADARLGEGDILGCGHRMRRE